MVLITQTPPLLPHFPHSFPQGGVGVLGTNKRFVVMQEQEQFPLTPEGYLVLPPSVQRIWVDVGAASQSFMDDCGVCLRSFWKNRESLKKEFTTSTDLFVIAIDANAAYSTSLRRLPRTIAITAAVSLCVISQLVKTLPLPFRHDPSLALTSFSLPPTLFFSTEGTMQLNNFAGPGCSSLLAQSDNVPAMDSTHPCRIVTGTTGVSVLRLDTILRLIPPSINIELLKVDAQGVDLAVVQSAGKELSRIGTLIVEVQETSANLLYKDQQGAAVTRAWIEGNGFQYDSEFSYMENADVAEANYVFRQSNL
jgi:hypothetical protein